jgi:GntR family transcriptional regulator
MGGDMPASGRNAPNASSPIVLTDTDVIDFKSVIPYYYQLQEHLMSKIRSGDWKPGQKLPSEHELCTHFEVSRTVVRQALNGLASEDLIITHKGKGSFVAAPKIAWKMMQSLSGFYDDAVASEKSISTQVLDLKVIPAEDEVAQFLHLAEGTPVIMLKRLRYLDGEPVVLTVTHIPERLCPELVNEDFTDQSLYRILASKYGFVLSEGIRTIESINAPQSLARLLGVDTGAALILLKSVGSLRDGTPLEYFIAWHRGDRSRFQVRLINENL